MSAHWGSKAVSLIGGKWAQKQEDLVWPSSSDSFQREKAVKHPRVSMIYSSWVGWDVKLFNPYIFLSLFHHEDILNHVTLMRLWCGTQYFLRILGHSFSCTRFVLGYSSGRRSHKKTRPSWSVLSDKRKAWEAGCFWGWGGHIPDLLPRSSHCFFLFPFPDCESNTSFLYKRGKTKIKIPCPSHDSATSVWSLVSFLLVCVCN